MSQNRRFHRARPNRPGDRIADTWAAYAIRVKAPSPTGQIQTLPTTREGLVGVPDGCGRRERRDGISFRSGLGH
jgi:hypothetical protein